ncbi:MULTISPECIES: hypothetical protein [unclassified Kitasatospora]|uniref:hypothetical protein n=1 Tax=unclassified Kitasatospora TaxID=2633591 RepID=UPI00070E197F|nr:MULTISPECIES: hypothetical protein [unclassified Kitasatospora]KQV13260.1 hypothetical protein ASC99_08515 [Kitasatospora sp. Root107]KRB75292.1 hypothetical protein ASE03_14890 [Kitasatospora sp. Root187]
MRVKLRPGTHFAPVRQGVHVARGGESFVLAGPPTLYTVLDSRLAELSDGTDVDALVVAFGSESARPVLDRILRTLVDRDVLLDLDALTTPAPDGATAARYAETLAYLEAHSPDPYGDFARLRGARVRVLGSGPAAEPAVRSLRRHGVADAVVRSDGFESSDDADGSEPVDPGWAVLIADHEHPSGPPAALPPGTRVVAVHAGEQVALVAELDDATGTAAFEAAAHRAAAWVAGDPEAGAPRPLSAVLAGALAARAVLAGLTGLDRSPGTATVIHGRQLRTSRIPLQDGPVGQDGPAGSLAAWTPPTEDVDPPAPHELLTAWDPLTTRWVGLVRRGRDLDLDQLPFALETVELLTGPAPTRAVGWGPDRTAAGVGALLAAARRLAGADGAAGATEGRWLLDGVLRQLGAELLLGRPGDPLGWDGLGSTEGRTLFGLLESWFDCTVELTRRQCPVLDWSLVTVTEQDGTVAATEWGETPAAAAKAALAAAVARAQADPEVRRLLAEHPVGTSVLETCSVTAVRLALSRLGTEPAVRGRTVRARRLTNDPVTGQLPLHCGPVRLS